MFVPNTLIRISRITFSKSRIRSLKSHLNKILITAELSKTFRDIKKY